MFGRQIFLESVDDRSEQWRRNECLRQLLATRAQQGTPSAQLTRVPFSRNDGFTLDLNFIVLDDPYLRTPRISTTDQFLLEYIRQMEERYAAMERELTRTKMLLPLMPRNTAPPRQTTNWKECSLAKKYGCNGANSSGRQRETTVGSQDALNREKINVSTRRRHHARRGRDSTVDHANWRNCRNTFQNSQNDVYPIRDPGSHLCRPKILNNDSTAVCSTHNVAVILPEDSPPLAHDSRRDQTLHRPGVHQFFPNGNTGTSLRANNNIILDSGNKRDATNMADSSGKSSITAHTQKPQAPMKNALMEACQRSDEKREPETSRCIDSNVKHEDYKQSGFNANGSILPSTMESKLHQDDSGRNPESIVRDSSDNLAEKRAIKRIKCFENTFARREENRLRKLQQERTGLTNDQARHLMRMLQKNVRTQKRVPTPRSNVHTACTPMVQPALSNPVLDPNGVTVRLLRLAVLLYAPTLLPALNSLIAQQNSQSAIPIPCFEGSNDLLTQLFRVLSSQQRVPNLSYTASPRPEETPRNSSVASSSSPSSNPEQRFQTLSKQSQDETTASTSRQELNSVGVDASFYPRDHANSKVSAGQCGESFPRERSEGN
ncbi:uncharacterized protein LOC143210325 [Lasioglossum baleicum]|uniref:uncharacterized protein LOC143210325 n=1 Tax=Lasioglossum baleicum TaxID=434251 RepID=UPI003FCC6B84